MICIGNWMCWKEWRGSKKLQLRHNNMPFIALSDAKISN
jgi:ABC-type nickel/cobalt efflux system permease component RcnA